MGSHDFYIRSKSECVHSHAAAAAAAGGDDKRLDRSEPPELS